MPHIIGDVDGVDVDNVDGVDVDDVDDVDGVTINVAAEGGRPQQIWKVSLDLADFRSARRDLYLRSI